MNEPDYCERCDLYTMQKQESEPEDTCEFWYCPVCDTFEEGKELVKQNDAEVQSVGKTAEEDTASE